MVSFVLLRILHPAPAHEKKCIMSKCSKSLSCLSSFVLFLYRMCISACMVICIHILWLFQLCCTQLLFCYINKHVQGELSIWRPCKYSAYFNSFIAKYMFCRLGIFRLYQLPICTYNVSGSQMRGNLMSLQWFASLPADCLLCTRPPGFMNGWKEENLFGGGRPVNAS